MKVRFTIPSPPICTSNALSGSCAVMILTRFNAKFPAVKAECVDGLNESDSYNARLTVNHGNPPLDLHEVVVEVFEVDGGREKKPMIIPSAVEVRNI